MLLEKNKKENKLSAPYESEPYKVTARYGDQIHIESQDGVRYKRNIQHLKRFHKENEDPVPVPQSETSTEGPQNEQSCTEPPPSEKPSTETETAVLRRSSRKTKPPERFKDYIVTKA